MFDERVADAALLYATSHYACAPEAWCMLSRSADAYTRATSLSCAYARISDNAYIKLMLYQRRDKRAVVATLTHTYLQQYDVRTARRARGQATVALRSCTVRGAFCSHDSSAARAHPRSRRGAQRRGAEGRAAAKEEGARSACLAHF